MDNNLLDQFEEPNIERDELLLWRKIVFIVIPLFGFITHFMISRRRPNAKQQALQFAGVGFVLGMILRYLVSN